MGYIIRPEFLSKEAEEKIRSQAIQASLKRLKEMNMAYIGISSRDVPDHPEWHPRLLYDELDEMAIADIRRRIGLGARAVVVEIVKEPGMRLKSKGTKQ